MPLTAKKARALAAPGSAVGPARYSLYKMAYGRINEALQQGFYLEAITIVESLVSDRLESRLTFLLGTDFSFKTLGQLITKIRGTETDSGLLLLVDKDLDQWREARNKSLHEMAKIEDGDSSTWADRFTSLVPTSKEGLRVLRAIDARCKALRKLGE